MSKMDEQHGRQHTQNQRGHCTGGVRHYQVVKNSSKSAGVISLKDPPSPMSPH